MKSNDDWQTIIIKFSLPGKIRSLPTQCLLCPLFHSLPRPPFFKFFAQTPSFVAQTSTFARSPAASRISGSWNAPVQMEGNRCSVYHSTIAVSLSLSCHCEPMADNCRGRQSRAGGGPKFGPANVSICWHWQADWNWLARSSFTRLLLLLHSDWAMNTPMIVTLTQHIIFPILCRTGSRTVSYDSTPAASPMLVNDVQPLQWSTVTICIARHDAWLPGQFYPTFTWTGREYSRLWQVYRSSSTKRGMLFESFGEPLRDNDWVERQSRHKGLHMYGGQKNTMAWDPCHGPCVPSPTATVFKLHQHACKQCFGKEMTEPSNLSDYDVNACGYYRLPADSCAAIDMGGATAVECIPISETVSNDGACNNECVIHYEGTTDAAQPVYPSPGIDRDPSATIESSTVLL